MEELIFWVRTHLLHTLPMDCEHWRGKGRDKSQITFKCNMNLFGVAIGQARNLKRSWQFGSILVLTSIHVGWSWDAGQVSLLIPAAVLPTGDKRCREEHNPAVHSDFPPSSPFSTLLWALAGFHPLQPHQQRQPAASTLPCPPED